MKKLLLTTAITLTLGVASNAAQADKLIANGDTGVDIQAIQQKLGIDPEAKSKTIMVNKNTLAPADADGGHVMQKPAKAEMQAKSKIEKETINFDLEKGSLATSAPTEAEMRAKADLAAKPMKENVEVKASKKMDDMDSMLANSELLNTEKRAAADAGIAVEKQNFNQ